MGISRGRAALVVGLFFALGCGQSCEEKKIRDSQAAYVREHCPTLTDYSACLGEVEKKEATARSARAAESAARDPLPTPPPPVPVATIEKKLTAAERDAALAGIAQIKGIIQRRVALAESVNESETPG